MTAVFQVDFHLITQIIPLPPGVPITASVLGTVAGDGMTYFSVTVPPDADYATNLLLSSTAPVNMWFNQNKVPVALSPPDYLLISNATNGVATLSATSVPRLVPGATYYLAVQDTNPATATFTLEYNFHLYTALTNGVPTTNSVPPNSFAYYTVTVPTNADYATNLLLFASLPVNVWFNQYAPPIGVSPSDSLLISNATSGVSILSVTSAPPLVPGATYYLGVQNTNAAAVNFGLEVDFHLVSHQYHRPDHHGDEQWRDQRLPAPVERADELSIFHPVEDQPHAGVSVEYGLEPGHQCHVHARQRRLFLV